jgi:hypothetical protein
MTDKESTKWKQTTGAVLGAIGQVVVKSIPWLGWGLLALAEILKFV